MSAGFRIVSLCGSAGALNSYIEIIKKMPADTGMVFIVLAHHRAGSECRLVQILSRITAMQVEEITDGTVFEANHVYVLPSGQDLTMDGSIFSLAPASKPRGWPDSFDIFLRSVARTTRCRAVTVILSGMAEDGSAAMQELQRGGGVNYAQSNAPYASMPESAIRTGYVDYVGSAGEIAAAILDLIPMGFRGLPRVMISSREPAL